MVEGQIRDRTRSIPTFLNTTRTRVRSRYRPTSAEIHRLEVRWGGRDGRREADSGLGYTQDYPSRYGNGPTPLRFQREGEEERGRLT